MEHREAYEWAINRLRAEFGPGNVIDGESDFGFTYGLGVTCGRYRTAVAVEKAYRLERDGVAAHFSLNEQPDKEQWLEDWIARVRGNAAAEILTPPSAAEAGLRP